MGSQAISKWRKGIDSRLNDFKSVSKSLRREKEELQSTRELFENTETAQSILQNVAQQLQKNAHDQISKVVTQCLQTVFYDRDYGLKIEFVKKRGKTEASLLLLNQGHEIQDPLNEDSGGVIDVASFALRVSCLMLSKPKLRRLLVMDEPFKNVSEEYRDNVRVMLEELSKDFKIQFILVTHEQGFKCGKVVQL